MTIVIDQDLHGQEVTIVAPKEDLEDQETVMVTDSVREHQEIFLMFMKILSLSAIFHTERTGGI